MTKFSADEDEYIGELAKALLLVKVTDREMRDMRDLYKATNGLPFDGTDSKNRPRSKTIQSSSTLGSKIKRATGAPVSHFGMSFIGYSKNDDKWYMKDVFRAAIERSKFFGEQAVVADELIPDDKEIDEDEAAYDEVLDDETLTETEREQIIQARVGQGKFRKNAELVSRSCRLTGVSDGRFLRASHIKPWHTSNNVERLDGNNGLMLAPHVDHLFDQGYISFEDDGHVIVSTSLPAEILKAWSLPDIAHPEKFNAIQAGYMAHHRANVFRQ